MIIRLQILRECSCLLSELTVLNLTNNELTQAQKYKIQEEVEAIAPDAKVIFD